MALSNRLSVARRCYALLSGSTSGAAIARGAAITRGAAMAMSLYARGGDTDVAPLSALDTCNPDHSADSPSSAMADDLDAMRLRNRHSQVPENEQEDDSSSHHGGGRSLATAAAPCNDIGTSVRDRDPDRTITRGGEEYPLAKQPSIRQKRVAIQIRSIICEEMERTALRDHLLGQCGFFIDGIRMSPDLRTAVITWTCDPQMAADAYRRVSSVASKLRSVVFHKLAMRFSPRLEFRYGGYGGWTQDEHDLEEAFERLKRED